jgi:hypothetical protein
VFNEASCAALRKCGRVLDGARIEDDEIRPHAGRYTAAIVQFPRISSVCLPMRAYMNPRVAECSCMEHRLHGNSCEPVRDFKPPGFRFVQTHSRQFRVCEQAEWDEPAASCSAPTVQVVAYNPEIVK